MRRIIIAVLLASVVCAIFGSAWAQESTTDVQRRVVLNVQEKNPRHAYWLTLWPVFGPFVGAEYAGSSPVSSSIPASLTKRAWIFAAIDFAEIAAGAGLGYWIGMSAEPETTESYTEEHNGVVLHGTRGTGEKQEGNRWIGLGVGAALGMIGSVVTNIAPAGFNANYCVEYNRKLHEEFRWRAPEVSYFDDAYRVSWGISF